QLPHWPQVEIQVFVLEPELPSQFLPTAGEQQERLAKSLDLFRRERAALDSPQRLPLHQLAKQLNEREHELRQALFEVFAVSVDPAAQGGVEPLQLVAEQLEVAVAGEQPVAPGCGAVQGTGFHHGAPSPELKLYGGHGPVQTTVASLSSSSRIRTRSMNGSIWSRGTR